VRCSWSNRGDDQCSPKGQHTACGCRCDPMTTTYVTRGFSPHVHFGGFLPIIRPRLNTTILRGLSTITNYTIMPFSTGPPSAMASEMPGLDEGARLEDDLAAGVPQAENSPEPRTLVRCSWSDRVDVQCSQKGHPTACGCQSDPMTTSDQSSINIDNERVKNFSQL
jgi:hypothetical protein